MAYLHSAEDWFRPLALDSAGKRAPGRHDTTTHDLGFLFPAVGALSPDHIPVWDYRAPQAPWR